MTFAGLDFGTSNSTIGIVKEEKVTLVPVEQGSPIMPSTIFYNYALNHYFFGETATTMYKLGNQGRYIKALKSILGTSFEDHKTKIGERNVSLKNLIGLYIKNLKDQAEKDLQEEITHVVAGRPVHFCDDDPEQDKRAENTLRSILNEQGFKEVHFQFEPFGAAKHYEQTIREEELALIADLGGGTSDFTIIKLCPEQKKRDRVNDILASDSVHIAGNDFDKMLNLQQVMPLFGYNGRIEDNRMAPSWIYTELSTWEMINYFCSNQKNINLVKSLKRNAPDGDLFKRLELMIDGKFPFTVLSETEGAKIKLSSKAMAELFFHYIQKDLSHTIKQTAYNEVIIPLIDKINQKALDTLKQGEVSPHKIKSIFFTGGTSSIPLLRRKILGNFPNAREVRGDTFGSVCHGLTTLAGELFG